MKKLVVILTVVLVLILVLAACGTSEQPSASSSPPPSEASETSKAPDTPKTEPPASSPTAEPEKQLRFTLILPMPRNDTWGPAADGFEEACKALGITPIVLVPGQAHDPNELNSLVETAIAEKVDALITVCYNPEAQDSAFKKLDDAGIPFCLINSDSETSNRLAFLGTGLSIGTVGGKAISDAMAGKEIHCVSASFTLTSTYINQMKDAYLDELRKHPAGFTETVLLDTGNTVLTTLQAWSDALMTYPEINAGFNIGGAGGYCAVQAIQEMKLNPDDFCIIGMDDVPKTMDAIRDGLLYGTMTQNFYRMGYEPVGWLKDFILEGKRPANVINDSGTLLVTKANIDTYDLDMRDPSAW